MGEFFIELIIGLLFVGPMVYYLWCQSIKDNLEKKERKAKQTAESIKKYISFDDKTGTLNVYDFPPGIDEIVTMKNYYIQHTGYQPESYTFTSATVGNVTTGGISKNEAYTYFAGTSKTDKYDLLYRNHSIRAIKLCSQKAKNTAKKAGMGKYMNAAGEIIVRETKRFSMSAMSAAASGYYTGLGIEQAEALPSYEKCKSILDFLYNSIDLSLMEVKTPTQTYDKKRRLSKVLLIILSVWLVIGFIGGAILLTVSSQTKIRAVLSDLEDTKMILVDPADLGLDGEEGFYYIDCYLYSKGKYYYYLEFHTRDNDQPENIYRYTVHVKKLKGAILYLDLKLFEETDNMSPGYGDPPKKITQLELRGYEDNDHEYGAAVLQDSQGNILAYAPNVELTDTGWVAHLSP